MPSEQVMDQRSMSPRSSYFLDEVRYPAETQIGFWNSETAHDHQGSKTVPSPLLEKLVPGTEYPQPFLVREQVPNLSLEQQVVTAEKTTNLSMTSWRSVDHGLGTRSNMFVQPTSYFTERNMGSQYENGLFSSSLSEIFSKKMRLSTNDVLFRQSVDAVTSHCHDEEPFESLEEIEAQTIGNLLPDDEDLLSGVNYNLKYNAQPNIGDDIEEFDLFSSGGGMELEGDDCLGSSRNLRISNISGANSNTQQEGLSSSSAGLHPYSEHPSRTLFVRNINSNIEDSELKAVFEQYGDIHTLYTACKHRGFVMISYYDIRAACDAIRALQNKPLGRRNLDIHFSIPKDNPSEKDINQGTLMVFNLDSVSNTDLHETFGVYGEIKEIRENPYKGHHKFIEFYDVRAAEAAFRALNKSDLAGKQIKLEPSGAGSVRMCSTQLVSPEQAGSIPCLQRGSPPNNSTSGSLGPVSHGAITSSCMEIESVQGRNSPLGFGVPISQFMDNRFYRSLPPSVPQRSPSLTNVATAGSQSGLGEPGFAQRKMEFNFQRRPPFHPHSLPEFHDGLACSVPYNSLGTMAANISSRPRGGFANEQIRRVGLNGHTDAVFDSGNGSCPLHGQQYMWSNSNYHSHPSNPMMWPNSHSFVNGVHGQASPQLHGLPRTPSNMLNAVLPIQHHHVGSAPTGNPSLWDRRHGYEGEFHETCGLHAGSIGSARLPGDLDLHHLELNSNIFPHGVGNCMDLSSGSTKVGLHSPQQRHHMFPRRNSMINLPSSFDVGNERVISRRNEVASSQADSKKLYDLDIDLILHGEDTRTTLMIKNIPNKYVK
ncbi:hypothetical protein AQUCO_08000010v1 [Aquilegia coerulea]|uniref:RRM domain-containing protein n=1 Tax=Aquilegia coerulea TaxID=218851 RepID=A0A2G5C7V2_AQUCA|nr:hypothetical protein AQUCO_08000010v1 [Aquilegia coerulea]